ncbi:MAG: peptidoglycan DD-metalloendopeptidase family protein [Pseudomonadota bacterium]
MRPLAALAVALWPLCAAAQTPPDAAARAALSQLADAARLLEEADGARDRIRALTATITAYEAGLAALRSSLRDAALREEQLSRILAARDEEIAALIGTLQAMGDPRTPVQLLHPSGPAGAARAGMILADLTPTLNARAGRLRTDLDAVRALRAVQEEAADQLGLGLSAVQEARTALSQAMAERTDLPRRFTEDPVRTAILIASAETLGTFAAGLPQIEMAQQTVALPPTSAQIGTLDLPARGLILRRANEPDAAGIARPGVLLATRPGALVTAPTAATVRYQGPLLDLGQVVILEPEPNALIILAGLGQVYVETGEVIGTQTPIGLMGGLQGGAAAETLSTPGDGGGNTRSETLYIETRRNNIPQDPETWFRAPQDG